MDNVVKDFKLTLSSVGCFVQELTKLLHSNPNKLYRVNVVEWREKRTLSQNSLFHLWMSTLSKSLIDKGRSDATPEFCKDLMKHTFLGYKRVERVNAVTGEKQTIDSLKHTSKTDVGEMTYFMDQVYAWCADKGIFLEIPEDSEYNKLRLEQER